MAKTVKITSDNAYASPDGVRIIKYSKGFVLSLPDRVAELLVKNKLAEESSEEPTNSQPIPAVENVATPGESVTGGGYGDARDPAVLGNAVEFVTGANSVRNRVAPLDAPAEGDEPKRERTDLDDTSSPPAQRVTTHNVAPTDAPVKIEDAPKAPAESVAPSPATKPAQTRAAPVKAPAQ